jgi:pimeloyl-ACP methyl ester carboxylesterase
MERLTVTTGDGARLVCWDFGGTGTPLLLLHGVGLHGRCWAPVAELLGDGLRPLALDMRGHGASGPSPDGRYDWDRFALDVLEVLDGLGLAAGPLSGGAGPGVLGVGHSAGASALLLAELDRPGSFSGLWTWEPIVIAPGDSVREQRASEFAQRARRRRSHFPSVAEARAHLGGRGMFAEFSAEAFEAFLTGGLVPAGDGGVQLACRPEDEARAYEAAVEHRLWDHLGAVHCPVRVLGGATSSAVPPLELGTIAARLRPAGPVTGPVTGPVAGPVVTPRLGHFGPFQDQAAIARDIAGWAGSADRAGGPGTG